MKVMKAIREQAVNAGLSDARELRIYVNFINNCINKISSSYDRAEKMYEQVIGIAPANPYFVNILNGST